MKLRNTDFTKSCKIPLNVRRKLTVFSQKLTSWVFNDQPCECAVVGQSRTIGRAAKIGWEKIGYPAPAERIRFYLHKEFRAAEIRFCLHKEFLKENREKSMIYVEIFPRCARQIVKNFVRKLMKNQ